MHDWKTKAINAVSDSAHTMHWLHVWRVIESAFDTGEIRVSLYKLQPGGVRLTHIMELPKCLTTTDAVDLSLIHI